MILFVINIVNNQLYSNNRAPEPVETPNRILSFLWIGIEINSSITFNVLIFGFFFVFDYIVGEAGAAAGAAGAAGAASEVG
eukprot:Pgem_evm1s4304